MLKDVLLTAMRALTDIQEAANEAAGRLTSPKLKPPNAPGPLGSPVPSVASATSAASLTTAAVGEAEEEGEEGQERQEETEAQGDGVKQQQQQQDDVSGAVTVSKPLVPVWFALTAPAPTPHQIGLCLALQVRHVFVPVQF